MRASKHRAASTLCRVPHTPPARLTVSQEEVSEPAGLTVTANGEGKRLLRGPGVNSGIPLKGNPQATVGVRFDQIGNLLAESARSDTLGRVDPRAALGAQSIISGTGHGPQPMQSILADLIEDEPDDEADATIEAVRDARGLAARLGYPGSAMEGFLSIVYEYLHHGAGKLAEQEYAKYAFAVTARTNLGVVFKALPYLQRRKLSADVILAGARIPGNGDSRLIAGGYDQHGHNQPGPTRRQWLTGILAGHRG